MNLQQKATLHNRFDFEIYDVKTGKTEYAQAENIVLNNMWTRVCDGSNYFNYIGVGKGTGNLSPTRTTLFNHLAYKSAVAVETVYDTDTTVHVTKSVTFSETEANGAWTEVGILYGTSTASNYVTHALITDSEGNTITINKTNTKIVTVYATVYIELLAPISGNYYCATGIKNMIIKNLIDGSSASGIFFTSLLTAEGKPSIIAGHDSLYLSWNSDAANKRRYSGLVRLTSENGNYPIRGMIVYYKGGETRSDNAGGVSLPLAGVFAGKNYVGVPIGTGDGSTEQFDMPLSFIKPNSETIYVGGVAKTRGSDYTIHYGMKSTETMLLDMPDAAKRLGSEFDTNLAYIEETLVLPQPSGAEATVTSIVLKNGTSSSHRCGGYDVKLSIDGVTWVNAGSVNSGWGSTIATLGSFTPDKYKFVKVKLIKGSPSSMMLSYIKIYATPPTTKHITFTTPPAAGAVITADFTTEYIAKTSNFVLDVQAEILFGEKV